MAVFGIPVKYIISFMRDLNSDEGRLELVMPVKRYLLKDSIVTQM